MALTRGWWNMACWNGLSADQQRRLIEVGNLPIDYKPDGWCDIPASICIETEHDEAPGPRFYCLPCALLYLQAIEESRRESGGPPCEHCGSTNTRPLRDEDGGGDLHWSCTPCGAARGYSHNGRPLHYPPSG